MSIETPTYLNIIQDAKRQVEIAKIMTRSDPEAARRYANKIMMRAKLSDCGRSSSAQAVHASDIVEHFLYSFLTD